MLVGVKWPRSGSRPAMGDDIVRHQWKCWRCLTNTVTESEDRIGALLSNDPTKLKENLEGFDSHSLRCHAFFPDELAERGLGDLDSNDPASINRIKDEASDLRQNAKPVSFL